MSEKHIEIRFPLWAFLNQPIFSSETELVLNPKRFAYLHRVKYLESCWTQNYNSKGRRCTDNF